MPRGVKVQKLQKGLAKHSKEDVGLMQQMFDQMTGVANADIEVVLPKYLKLRHDLLLFIKTYTIFIKFEPIHTTFTEFHNVFKEIEQFIDRIKTECEFTDDDLNEKDTQSQSKYEKLTQAEINDLYKQLKAKECVKIIITTAGKLSRHAKMIDELNDGFIKREPGLSMYLLSFSNLDFKAFWLSQKMTPTIKKFMMTIINHTYHISYSIYDTVTSPDIDIKKFSSVLVASLDGLRKQIPRCEDAFNIISNSVKLLEDKFKGYYKSSVEAENPSMILESFVIDVSMQQSSTNMKVAQQFKKIIMYMRRAASENKDPRVKKIFNMLNTQFKSMEEKTGEKSDDISNVEVNSSSTQATDSSESDK